LSGFRASVSWCLCKKRIHQTGRFTLALRGQAAENSNSCGSRGGSGRGSSADR
jgi:hypothetical protein